MIIPIVIIVTLGLIVPHLYIACFIKVNYMNKTKLKANTKLKEDI